MVTLRSSSLLPKNDGEVGETVRRNGKETSKISVRTRGLVQRGEEKRQEKEKEVQCEDRKSWRRAGQRGTGRKYHE